MSKDRIVIEKLDPGNVDADKEIARLFNILKRSIDIKHMNLMTNARRDNPLLNITVAGVLAASDFVSKHMDSKDMKKQLQLTEEEARDFSQSMIQSMITDILLTNFGEHIKQADKEYEKK